MAGPILYSANPWLAHDFSMKYRSGTHFAWCSEYYDPTSEPSVSAAAAIAPSSSPRGIFEILKGDCDREDRHSSLIKGYRKTFKRLAARWLADGSIDLAAHNEIVAVVKSSSWKIWRPVLYVVPRALIESTGRLIAVPHDVRAAYGAEFQIANLARHEFDILVSPPR
jgi:hypothetical protein